MLASNVLAFGLLAAHAAWRDPTVATFAVGIALAAQMLGALRWNGALSSATKFGVLIALLWILGDAIMIHLAGRRGQIHIPGVALGETPPLVLLVAWLTATHIHYWTRRVLDLGYGGVVASAFAGFSALVLGTVGVSLFVEAGLWSYADATWVWWHVPAFVPIAYGLAFAVLPALLRTPVALRALALAALMLVLTLGLGHAVGCFPREVGETADPVERGGTDTGSRAGEEVQLRGRALPSESPVVSEKGTTPGGGVLRIALILPPDLPGRRGPIMLALYRDGDAKPRTLFLLRSYLRGHVFADGLQLEQDGEARSEGHWPLKLSGLRPGDYTVFVRTAGGGSKQRFGRPRRIRVGDGAASVDLPLPPASEDGTLDVVVERGGHKIRSVWCSVRAGPFFVKFVGGAGFGRPEGSPIAIPADTDLTVSLPVFTGRWERGDVEPQQVRVEPGQRKTVRFVLPEGTPVRVVTTRASGEEVKTRLRLWRLDPEGVSLRLDAKQAELKYGGLRGHLIPGRYLVLATPRKGRATGVPATVEFTVPEDGDVRVPVTIEEVDRNLTLDLRDEYGKRLPYKTGFRLWREAETLADLRCMDGSLGPPGSRLPDLPAGTYHLAVFGWGYGKVEIYDTHEQALEVHLSSTEWPEGTSNLRGCIRREGGGVPTRDCAVYLQRDDGETVRVTWALPSLAVASYRFDDLPAGTYTLRIPSSLFHGPPHADIEQRVELLEGRDRTVDVTLRPR